MIDQYGRVNLWSKSNLIRLATGQPNQKCIPTRRKDDDDDVSNMKDGWMTGNIVHDSNIETKFSI